MGASPYLYPFFGHVAPKTVVTGGFSGAGDLTNVYNGGAWTRSPRTPRPASRSSRAWHARRIPRHRRGGVQLTVALGPVEQETVVTAYMQVLFTIGLRLDEARAWHLEGERNVIRELIGIQDQLLDSYARFLSLVRERHGRDIATAGVCEVS